MLDRILCQNLFEPGPAGRHKSGQGLRKVIITLLDIFISKYASHWSYSRRILGKRVHQVPNPDWIRVKNV